MEARQALYRPGVYLASAMSPDHVQAVRILLSEQSPLTESRIRTVGLSLSMGAESPYNRRRAMNCSSPRS